MDRLKQILARGDAAIGTIVTMPGVAPVQVLGSSGLDFILIDMEHGPISMESACAMVAASAASSVAPLVRIASNEPWLTKTLVDVGALGVAVPMVNSGLEAARAVGPLRYPPAGTRAWGPFYAPMRWGMNQSQYAALANDAMVGIVIVENHQVLDHLDEILAVDGVDVVLIGAGDLASSLGYVGDMHHPDVRQMVRRVEARVLASGKALGGFAATSAGGKALLDDGYRFVICGTDGSLLAGAVETALADMRLPLSVAHPGAHPCF